jgi:hypothetical protein
MKTLNFDYLIAKALLIIEEFEVYEILTEITVALCSKTITQDEGVTILKIVMEKHAPIDSFR